MRFFLIGDVHGCFHTFKKMIEEHWDPTQEILVQLGDCVDRGNFIIETLDYAHELRTKYPQQAYFLLGNHEDAMARYVADGDESWLHYGGTSTIKQYEAKGQEMRSALDWISSLPVFWDHEALFMSHAGVSPKQTDPEALLHPYSMIWARGLLKDLGKPQVVGHSPIKKPLHVNSSNTFYIDSGAVYGNALSGVKLAFSPDHQLLSSHFCSIPTLEVDYTGGAHLRERDHYYLPQELQE